MLFFLENSNKKIIFCSVDVFPDAHWMVLFFQAAFFTLFSRTSLNYGSTSLQTDLHTEFSH